MSITFGLYKNKAMSWFSTKTDLVILMYQEYKLNINFQHTCTVLVTEFCAPLGAFDVE